MEYSEKLELICNGLEEIIGKSSLEKKLQSGEPFRIYWGTAPTGKPHIGYLVPLIKIADFVKAGAEVTILFADLHAYLDSMKTSWELLSHRTKYYTMVIQKVLETLGVDLSKIKFVCGSDYQLSKEYMIDVYKFMGKLTVKTAKTAGAEVVKQTEDPLLSGVVYPLLQVLDEIYLNVDAELGGVDQRKIFMLSHDHLQKLGYKPVIHMMNKMLPGFDNDPSGKMSSSSSEQKESLKIELTESEKQIRKKIGKAYLPAPNTGMATSCGLFQFVQHVIFAINKDVFRIERDEKWGGPIEYDSYEELTHDYLCEKLSPQDLKLGVSDWLIQILRPVRELFEIPDNIELEVISYSHH